MPKTPSTPKPISATKHDEKRANIPTEELRDFVADDENNPVQLRYPRDPSLDPQLVWQGKDEQDGADLIVPAVPIYIQEKIHPQAIIEDVRATAQKGQPQQLDMFSDFNGLPFEDLIEFYQHQQHWSNRLILGDSLQVMTSLAEKEGLKGQVQMIYLDPPYGIKFGSNWQVSTRNRQVKDGKAEDVTRQPEQVKAFRDTWELGIHSYLSYLRDRLVVARELLTESGSVFVQIGDENVHLVRSLLDEVFGSENFISAIAVEKTGGKGSSLLDSVYDTLLWYAKTKEIVKYRPLFTDRKGSTTLKRYNYLEKSSGEVIKLTRNQIDGREVIPDGRRWGDYPLHSQGETTSETSHAFVFRGKKYYPKSGRHWTTTPANLRKLEFANRIVKFVTEIRYKRYADDFPIIPIDNIWTGTLIGVVPIYVVQTATKIIERCILMATDPGDLVLDPTCGSGTTAYVAEQWGRRWITVDTSRVSITLTRTRLMAARFPYYLLSDSPEGRQKEIELSGQLPDHQGAAPSYQSDIRKGFVYKHAPHIMLRDIAKNEEIEGIYEKYQAQIEPVLKDLQGFENLEGLAEWKLPRESEADWPQEVKDQLAQYWSLRRQRQGEIDASIARNSESETLYDQPYEDNKRLRVTGPFTVESLSPHRVLAADQERPASESAGQEAQSGSFVQMILDNLKKAGVQNTFKNERLKFDRLEPFAGEWLQAEGEYTESPPSPSGRGAGGEGETGGGGVTKRVAVALGPEHGTVGPQLVKEAAKEAVRGVGFDLLIVCGFAFDPHVSEEIKRYGALTVLPARMNPDLAMGDELLKKTGSGNLFMVFGEPDVQIRNLEGDQIQVEIRGLDIYDPTTGQIRSSSTDDVACWFIDTAYNEESFFVRHAYFTGADKPYEQLQRTLRADVDEEAWESLYSTTSRPFDRPECGKIAIKVINHFGDEVLKVYEV